MNTNYTSLCDAIEYSPLLADEQKMLIIDQIEAGEPFSPELAEVIVQFANMSIEFEQIVEDATKERVLELDAKLREMDTEEMSESEIQEKAKEIISIVDEFLAESKKIEKDYDETVESLVHENAEVSEIDAIRSKLKSKS